MSLRFNIAATASTDFACAFIESADAATIPAGTTDLVANVHIQEENWTAKGSIAAASL